jgi:hypothetical protein
MPYQDLNVTLSDADRQATKQAITTIQQKLPFLITLSADERKRLYKMGDKRLAFVQNGLPSAKFLCQVCLSRLLLIARILIAGHPWVICGNL